MKLSEVTNAFVQEFISKKARSKANPDGLGEKSLIIPTALPKAVTTKLKSLKETHTVTKISEDSETVFYIFFLINN